MTVWLLEAAFYAAMAGLVIFINRRFPLACASGVALLAFSLLSSATFFMGLPFELRLIREMLLVTFVAWVIAIPFLTGKGWLSTKIALVMCLLDVGFCGALCLHGSDAPPIRSLFGWVVNINFVILCGCVATPGIADAVRRWIANIDRVRASDSTAPDMDWALRNIDG